MILLTAPSVRAAEPESMFDYTAAQSLEGGTPFFQASSGSGATPQAPDGCCPPNGCWPPNGCCGGVRCCTGCGFYGGAEVAFLRPYFNNDVAVSRFTVASAAETTTDFTSSYTASPRIWLGYVNCCGFGGRLRYWEYDQGGSPREGAQTDLNTYYFAPGIPIGSLETTTPGDLLSTSERLHMYTLDAEITQCLQICCWDFNFGGGLRDASVHIDRTNAFTGAGTTVFSEVATIGNHFDGVGPTMFAEFRRPFGCGGLAFVGDLRGSLLYGTKSLRATDVTSTQTQAYDQTANGCLGVAELSLGIEWSREISCNTTVFVNGLWENQIWTNMGNSTSITGDNLGLGGFTLGVGLYH
jgi:hypothetical protein